MLLSIQKKCWRGKQTGPVTYIVSHVFMSGFFFSFNWKANRLKEVEGTDSFQACSVKYLQLPHAKLLLSAKHCARPSMNLVDNY